MAQLSIRPVRVEDLREVLEIERLSFARPYPPSYLDTLAHLSPSSFLVVTLEERVVGYAAFSMKGKVAHLLSIAVHPEHRRRGIGTSLLKAMIVATKAKKASLVRLEVRKSNVEAQRLYTQAGLSVSHMVYSYYDDGEDAVVMEMAL